MLTCKFYQQHDMGELDERAFAHHVQDCPLCQKILQQDEQLLALTRDLPQPAASPLLWAKIENTLRAERQRSSDRKIDFRKFDLRLASKSGLFRWAAVLLLLFGIGSYFIVQQPPEQESSRLLTKKALQQVARTEQEYLKAIAQLEQAAVPQMAQLDVELMLLYRDRLETIDGQINRCQEALAKNPANTHIRRYLLAALQDKKATLQELVKRSG